MLPDNFSNFIKVFAKLPGIGNKTSERLGFYILSQPSDFAEVLADSIRKLKSGTVVCSICGNIDERDPCGICSDSGRLSTIICVIENVMDLYYMESTNNFNGLYHVLGGLISPLNGILPSDLSIDGLLSRVNRGNIQEVIFATSPTTEGDSTVLYIKQLLSGKGIRLTHLARGIPVGTGLQYAGSGSLKQALSRREEL